MQERWEDLGLNLCQGKILKEENGHPLQYSWPTKIPWTEESGAGTAQVQRVGAVGHELNANMFAHMVSMRPRDSGWEVHTVSPAAYFSPLLEKPENDKGKNDAGIYACFIRKTFCRSTFHTLNAFLSHLMFLKFEMLVLSIFGTQQINSSKYIN